MPTKTADRTHAIAAPVDPVAGMPTAEQVPASEAVAPSPTTPAPTPTGSSSPNGSQDRRRVPAPLDALDAPRPSTPAPADGTPIRSHDGGRRRAPVLVGLGALVLVAAGTTAGIVASRPDPPAAAAAPIAVAPSAATWLTTNLPAGATVVTDDPRLASALQADGVDATPVGSLDAARPDAFVVTTSTAPTASTASTSGAEPVAAGPGHAFVPLARFTAGSTVVVGQVVDDSLATVTAGRSEQRDTTRAATTGLLQNPEVSVPDPATRAVFAEGRLDLRAAAFLAVVTGSGSVTVRGAAQDPAEQAVGLPVRQLVVTVSSGVDLLDLAAATRAPYSPTVSTPDDAADLPAGTAVLTWPVTGAPTT